MDFTKCCYSPAFDPAEIKSDLAALLVPGVIADRDLHGRIARLAERFRVYTATCPCPAWAPGAVITSEMRSMTELYLPLDEIRRAFHRLFSLTLRVEPFFCASPFHTLPTWLDVLARLAPSVRSADPAKLLRRLAADEGARTRFLFSVFLPRHYGGSFARYPEQEAFLRGWLRENRGRLGTGLGCLDAACGAGEGSYGLASLLLAEGFGPESFAIRGSTREPVELFAAAHGYFPHDREREAAFRRRVLPLQDTGVLGSITFRLEDITEPAEDGERYDVILCNGILGGPFLHERGALERTMRGGASRLAPGGIFLAADRFHGGWKRSAAPELLREMIVRVGLKPLPVGEGVAGVRTG